MSLPSRTSLRRGEACRLGGSGAMAQSCAITLKTTTKSITQVRRDQKVMTFHKQGVIWSSDNQIRAGNFIS